jgi:hypothetical protein
MEQYINTSMMYEHNEDFKRYVDRYMVSNGADLRTALSHAMVRNYADYLTERGAGETKLPNMWGSAGAAHENMAEI